MFGDNQRAPSGLDWFPPHPRQHVEISKLMELRYKHNKLELINELLNQLALAYLFINNLKLLPHRGPNGS